MWGRQAAPSQVHVTSVTISPMPRSRHFARALGACLLLALPVLGAACKGDSDPTEPEPTAGIAPRVRAYLDTAILFTQEYFYYGDRVNWTAVRQKAFQTAGSAQTFAATYPAIDEMIRGLNDNHSFFYEPSESLGEREDPAIPFNLPAVTTVNSRVGYLWVPIFGGKSMQGRADTLQRYIARADSVSNLCGWIIDLRGNYGGFWPAMLAGISPLITAGRVGGYVERDTTYRVFYEVRPGVSAVFERSTNRSFTYVELPQAYQLRHTNLPVAILQGGFTASAGEIIVMAFKEPNRAVRTFGRPTLGATSQPYTYRMADRASIQVTAAMMFDRQGRQYGGGPIPPDEDVAGPAISQSYVPGANTTNDAVITAATNWLNRQPSCASAADLEPGEPTGGRFVPTTPIPGALPGSAWPRRGTPWIAGGTR
jgi:carboxyl-terminal processing protease